MNQATRHAHLRRISKLPRRGATGEKNHAAKLTTVAVEVIRRSDESTRALAHYFGVHQSTVCVARQGKTWQGKS